MKKLVTVYELYPLNIVRDLKLQNINRVYLAGVEKAIVDLLPREKEIIDLRYKERLTYQEIAKKQELTRERIRQILAKSLRKLMCRQNEFIAISMKEHNNIIDELKKEHLRLQKEIYLTALSKRKDEPMPDELIVINDMPIEELDLAVRAYNCLKRSRINTVGELIGLTETQLIRIRNLGRKSFDHIKQVLLSKGLELKQC